jgi:hypothetical protein
MIITTVDNSTFENMYSNIDSTTYMNKFISGLDAIGVYDYINTIMKNNISSWSEPNFMTNYMLVKKLNIIGSDLNDTTVTVNNLR